MNVLPRWVPLALGVLLALAPRTAPAAGHDPVELTVASYNVHGVFFPDYRECLTKTRKYRFSRIADEVDRYDVVLLQELFQSRFAGTRFQRYLFEPSNHPFQRPRDPKRVRRVYGVGLAALVGPRFAERSSGWTLTEYRGFHGQYPLCSGVICRSNDCFSTKGYARFEIQLFGHPLVFYVTHMDAGGHHEDRRVRVGQWKELGDAVLEDRKAGRAILVAGDFNTVATTGAIDGLELKRFEQELNLSRAMPGPSPDPDDRCDWEHCEKGVIDHLFYGGGDHLKVEVASAHWRRVPGGKHCTRLSDHPMLVATLRVSPVP